MRIFNRTGATVDIDDPSEFAKALLLYIQHALDHAEATQSSSSLTSAGENQAGGGVFRDAGGTIDDLVMSFEGIVLDDDAQYGTTVVMPPPPYNRLAL